MPHRARFNRTNVLIQKGGTSSRDSQLAVSFVKSVLRKHNLPFNKLTIGYEADQFLVIVTHPQLGFNHVRDM